MRCPACGEEVVSEAVFCHKCGQRLKPENNETANNSPKNGFPPSDPAGLFQQAVASRADSSNLPEQEIWHGGYSPKAMLGSWVACGVGTVVLFLFGLFVMSWTFSYWLILLLAMVLPWLYFLAVLSYRRMSVRYSLSTQRFIHESGFLRRINDRIELLDVDDITFEQGPCERLMGVGTLRVTSHDRSHPDLVLPGIEDIKKVASDFDNARLAERRRRGLHVEQI
jgi:membrane protein YdbS with pleckstrin-like domain